MKKFEYDSFIMVCERLFDELSLKKDKQLIEILETSQPTFSRRKIEGIFPVEWAYLISIRYGLLTEWVLTGKGPKKIGSTMTDQFFSDLEQWGKETGKSDNLEWLKAQIEMTFPMFKVWRKSRWEG
jgi:hypothetical protein